MKAMRINLKMAIVSSTEKNLVSQTNIGAKKILQLIANNDDIHIPIVIFFHCVSSLDTLFTYTSTALFHWWRWCNICIS